MSAEAGTPEGHAKNVRTALALADHTARTGEKTTGRYANVMRRGFDSLRALAAEAGTLDEAWAAAEAALPDDNWILGLHKTDRGEGRGAYEATAGDFGLTPDDDTSVYANSPAAALHALAVALRGVPA